MTGEAQAMLDGGLAILPTDTVYGIGAAAAHVQACRRLYELKARPPEQPVSVAAGSVDGLASEVIPDAGPRALEIVRRLLPGPLTLIVPHPGGRFAHLCGGAPALGVRVPVLQPAVASLMDAVGGVALTSANLRGRPAPAELAEVPEELLDACAVVMDGGRLHGAASAVIDVTGPQPAVLREGPGAADALRAVAGMPA